MRKVCVSGYYNPLHIGHLAYIRAAKALGDHLTVIVNNDKQVALKGAQPFMHEEARVEIMRALRDVDEVVLSIDIDRSVARTLELVKPNIFCNGGDVARYEDVNPSELEVCRAINCEVMLGVGGCEKIESSSRLVGQRYLDLYISPEAAALLTAEANAIPEETVKLIFDGYNMPQPQEIVIIESDQTDKPRRLDIISKYIIGDGLLDNRNIEKIDLS